MDGQVSLPTPLESFCSNSIFYCKASRPPAPRTFWRFLFLALVPLLSGANGKYAVSVSEAEQIVLLPLLWLLVVPQEQEVGIERNGQCGRDCGIRIQYMTW